MQKALNPAQEAELKFLKQRVDRCQDERFRPEASPNANQNLMAASEELSRYVKELRTYGYHI
jgi:hypothetical protein